jgi:hypothetical protein
VAGSNRLELVGIGFRLCWGIAVETVVAQGNRNKGIGERKLPMSHRGREMRKSSVANELASFRAGHNNADSEREKGASEAG